MLPLCPDDDRVELLPIGWQDVVHSTDYKDVLESCTLPGVRNLRGFANGVIMDVLFYMSPRSGARHACVRTCRGGWERKQREGVVDTGACACCYSFHQKHNPV